MAQQNKEQSVVSYEVVSSADLGMGPIAVQETTNAISFAVCIRVAKQKMRQGTVACKGRSDVNLSNKKPWKQKGTGRARAGTRRSPLWRGGGVTFGPQPRTKQLTVPRKIAQGVLASLFWHRLESQQIIALDYQTGEGFVRTAAMHKIFEQAQLHKKKILFFVATHDYALQFACANLPYVQMYLFDQPNVYALSQGDCWVYLKKDTDSFKQMVDAWI